MTGLSHKTCWRSHQELEFKQLDLPKLPSPTLWTNHVTYTVEAWPLCELSLIKPFPLVSEKDFVKNNHMATNLNISKNKPTR